MTRVLVLGGGSSNERDVSLRSRANVAQALIKAGYDVVEADPADEDFDLDVLVKDVDAVLPMLHGAGGEDGTIQQQLERLQVPYFGSDSAASALAFDKVRTKQALEREGILTPAWAVVNREQFNDSPLSHQPYVLKPVGGGSTIDTVIVHDPVHGAPEGAKLDGLFGRYDQLLLEELIEGTEITVGVLDDKPLPVILIVPPTGQDFDYANKYNGASQEITRPAQVNDELQQQARQLAMRVHHVVGARHISRTDIIINDSGELYVLEINTLPGMTEQSLIPKAALAESINIKELVSQFVTMAQRDTHLARSADL